MTSMLQANLPDGGTDVREMTEDVHEQAMRLECLLPMTMARLFRLDKDHPLAEMPLAQLRVCVYLQGGPRTMSAIGEEYKISVSAVTQMADRLERGDFVERVVDTDDRRQKMLRLTEYGAKVMRSRRETRVGRVHETLKRLSPEQRATLIESIAAFSQAAREVNDLPDELGYVAPQP
jgi:DNA-binding MarR family transcriptional regulator